MATASVTQLSKIEREDGHDISLSGLLSILTRRTSSGNPDYSELGGLKDRELMTVAIQARNVQTAALQGLQTVGTLVSCFDTNCAELDHNAVGWLTCHLTETAEAMGHIEWEASRELADRGYNTEGLPLRQRAQA